MRALLLIGGLVGLYLWNRKEKANSLSTLSKRSNPSTPKEQKELTEARRLSQKFHGHEGYVIELEPRERHMPRYAVALGSVPDLSYVPGSDSARGGYHWVHKTGDRGFLRRASRGKPLLAIHPFSKKPILVQHTSSMKLDTDKGLVG